MQETTEEALKHSTVNSTKKKSLPALSSGDCHKPSRAAASSPVAEPVANTMNIILGVAGNQQCADCGSTVGEQCGVGVACDGSLHLG